MNLKNCYIIEIKFDKLTTYIKGSDFYQASSFFIYFHKFVTFLIVFFFLEDQKK